MTSSAVIATSVLVDASAGVEVSLATSVCVDVPSSGPLVGCVGRCDVA